VRTAQTKLLCMGQECKTQVDTWDPLLRQCTHMWQPNVVDHTRTLPHRDISSLGTAIVAAEHAPVAATLGHSQGRRTLPHFVLVGHCLVPLPAYAYLWQPHVVVASIWVDAAEAQHCHEAATGQPAAHLTSTGLHHIRVLGSRLFGVWRWGVGGGGGGGGGGVST
jgi:hypothetical protein